jgi:hypothetical protein
MTPFQKKKKKSYAINFRTENRNSSSEMQVLAILNKDFINGKLKFPKDFNLRPVLFKHRLRL